MPGPVFSLRIRGGQGRNSLIPDIFSSKLFGIRILLNLPESNRFVSKILRFFDREGDPGQTPEQE